MLHACRIRRRKVTVKYCPVPGKVQKQEPRTLLFHLNFEQDVARRLARVELE